MTLVEVLVTLVLASLVIALIWTTVSISMKYNITESKKLNLQQEANYIITKLQQEHRQRDCYKIDIKENQVSISNCGNDPLFQEIISNGFYYSPVGDETINTRTDNLEINNFTISDSRNEKLNELNKPYVIIPILISRYKPLW